MTMDFSGSAGAVSDFDILPKGLLVFANLGFRALKSSASGGRYLDMELTIDQGQPYAGRKLWEMIGDPFFPGNSEEYRKMGMIAVTRILESGRGAGPNNPAGYKIDDFAQLNGLRVAIKVGVEPGRDGHDDKNRVAEWLTPNPASQSGHKGYQKLVSGDHGLGANAPGATPPSGFGSAPVAAGGGQQASGFGGAAASAGGGNGAPAGSGPGNGSGFTTPQTGGSGQPGAESGATTAGGQSQSPGAIASPSNAGQQTSGGWLEQAQGGAQGQGSA